MVNSRYFWRCLFFTLSINQLLLMIVLAAQAQETITSKDYIVKQVILQESFNPPRSGQPKGSSGSGSRRIVRFGK
jgi:hypothetical protein